ncbi:Ribose-phosphate pyrophosphokinase 2 [Lecanora helva]
MTLTGEVKNKSAILIDDMADTCGTLCKAAEKISQAGASEVISIVTHGILSGDAIRKLNDCTALSRVVVTNTVPLQGKEIECEKIAVVDISPTLAGMQANA